jgi:hypothetical protein
MVDPRRCQELIDGSDPENTGEELFILCFEGAINNQDLGELVMTSGDAFNSANISELEMIIVGYSTGQRQRKIDLGIVDNIH